MADNKDVEFRQLVEKFLEIIWNKNNPYGDCGKQCNNKKDNTIPSYRYQTLAIGKYRHYLFVAANSAAITAHTKKGNKHSYYGLIYEDQCRMVEKFAPYFTIVFIQPTMLDKNVKLFENANKKVEKPDPKQPDKKIYSEPYFSTISIQPKQIEENKQGELQFYSKEYFRYHAEEQILTLLQSIGNINYPEVIMYVSKDPCIRCKDKLDSLSVRSLGDRLGSNSKVSKKNWPDIFAKHLILTVVYRKEEYVRNHDADYFKKVIRCELEKNETERCSRRKDLKLEYEEKLLKLELENKLRNSKPVFNILPQIFNPFNFDVEFD